jgi:hypothetical protein
MRLFVRLQPNAAITWPQRAQLDDPNRLEAAQVHGIVMPIMTEYQRFPTG